jgi:hypothetical protein
VLHDFIIMGAAETVGDDDFEGAIEGAEDLVGAAVFSLMMMVALIVFVVAPSDNFPVAETMY